MVKGRRKERVDQILMSTMYFNQVNAGLNGAASCMAESLYNIKDFLLVHKVGHKHGTFGVKAYAEAALVDLDTCFAAGFVYGIHKTLNAGNIFVLC